MFQLSHDANQSIACRRLVDVGCRIDNLFPNQAPTALRVLATSPAIFTENDQVRIINMDYIVGEYHAAGETLDERPLQA